MLEKSQIVVFNNKVGRVLTDGDKFRFLPAGYGRYYTSELPEITENIVIPATTEDKFRFITENFVWGKVIKIHTISDFQIIEADREGVTYFHVYIDFNDTNNSADTIDEAIITALVRKYDGINSQAACFISRILGI